MEAIGEGVRWIFFLVCLPVLGIFAFPKALVDSFMHSFFLPASYIFFGVIAVVSLAILLSNAIAAMCLAVYGKELFMSSANPQVSTNSAPDCPGPIAIHTLTRNELRSPGGFRHFIYNEPGCAEYVVRWAAARIAGKHYVDILVYGEVQGRHD
ncbi:MULTISPECIES: hypothetical protein [Bradyrhizobium]|uniref:Uncharacterized protein n=1 Tax=Bradyrhizobium frederickii TaxID=2560054 RepID=A0A4Y9KSH9_9BRAD|nr:MULTISPECIES: hypothetical protein [Bradyrhizobium]RTE88419.1 hypothetical protein D6B98_35995 [Bradyrhizobium sp. LVM 105]TFV30147.1 hypothetical protein E4K66_36625 [Bradyrhizobium frederickii]TFV70224.1 hypothetical protein E4K64_30680 [Bradyrhizobium frederickii]